MAIVEGSTSRARDILSRQAELESERSRYEAVWKAVSEFCDPGRARCLERPQGRRPGEGSGSAGQGISPALLGRGSRDADLTTATGYHWPSYGEWLAKTKTPNGFEQRLEQRPRRSGAAHYGILMPDEAQLAALEKARRLDGV